MRFMTVDALELDGLSVDQHRAVIGDFHGTEADIDGPGVLPVQGIGHLVQIGRFRRPRLHAGKLPVQSHLNLASGGNGGNFQRAGIQPAPVVRLHAAGAAPALPI